MAIIDQAIKLGLLNYWLMNWTKPKVKVEDKNKVSNYRTIMVAQLLLNCITLSRSKR